MRLTVPHITRYYRRFNIFFISYSYLCFFSMLFHTFNWKAVECEIAWRQHQMKISTLNVLWLSNEFDQFSYLIISSINIMLARWTLKGDGFVLRWFLETLMTKFLKEWWKKLNGSVRNPIQCKEINFYNIYVQFTKLYKMNKICNHVIFNRSNYKFFI